MNQRIGGGVLLHTLVVLQRRKSLLDPLLHLDKFGFQQLLQLGNPALQLFREVFEALSLAVIAQPVVL